MKRLLTAFGIALAIHGLVLALTFKRHSFYRLEKEQERPVTMTFTYREPIKKILQKTPPPVATPPEKTRKAPPKQVKQKQQPDPKPIKQAKSIPPPLPKPQPTPLTSAPQSAPEKPPAAVRKDVPPAMPTAAPAEEAIAPVDIPTETKRTTGPPIHKARPLYRQNPPPRYPRTARRRGYEGSVVLEVKVLKNGTVGDLRVLESSGHTVLDKAALKSVRNWLFEPGRQGEQEVDMWVRVPIRFEIE